MRFNIDDLKRGNISKERFDEIVKEVRYKVDELQEKSADLKRNISTRLNTLEKEIVFNAAHDYSFALFPDSSEYKEHYIKLVRATKLKQFNRELLEMEALLEHMKIKERKKAHLARLRYLKMERERRMISAANYEARIAALRQEEFDRLIRERNQIAREIDALQKEILYYDNIIKLYEVMIRASRKKAINQMVSVAREVNVNGVYTFEGMDDKQIYGFMQGYLVIEELRRKELRQVEKKYSALIAEERQKMEMAIQKNPGKEKEFKDQFALNEKRLREEWKKERNQINAKADNLILKNGDRTGNKYINSEMARKEPHTCKAHIHAFKEHKVMKKASKDHLELADNMNAKKEEATEAKNNIKAQMEDKNSNLREVDENLQKRGEKINNTDLQLAKLLTKPQHAIPQPAIPQSAIPNSSDLPKNEDGLSVDDIANEFGIHLGEMDLDNFEIEGIKLDDLIFGDKEVQLDVLEESTSEKEISSSSRPPSP